MKQRRGGAPPKGQPQAQGKTRRAKSAAPPRVPSPWQEAPPELITILERLLAMEDGNRWVRVASHVCSFWRATAQEVLLADTAISKPPLEDFRAIGARQPPAQPVKAAKADTVATQAAVVMEATASTGMEAISKQRFDAPPAVVGGTGGGRRAGSCGRGRRSLAAAQRDAPARLQQRQAAAAERAQAGLAAAQQGALPPAAASPNQPRRQAVAAPQGSIQSGMAFGNPAGAGDTDSDSDGSTRAQVGAGAKKRRRRRRRARSGGQAGSVEKPQRQQQQQQQQQEPQAPARRAAAAQLGPGTGNIAGPSSAAARPRAKRPAGAAEEAQPSKRQYAGQQARRRQQQQQQEEEALQAVPGAGAGLRAGRPSAQPGAAAMPPCQAQQPELLGLPQLVQPPVLNTVDSADLVLQRQRQAEASGWHPAQQPPPRQERGQAAPPAGERRREQQQAEPSGKGASGASGSYYEHEGGMEVEQEQPPPRSAQPAQREGSGGPMQGLVGFVKRFVGL